MRGRALTRRAAAVAAVACVAVAMTADLLLAGGASARGSSDLVPVLVSLALLCIVGLTIDRAPSVALVGAALSAGNASIGLIGLLRAQGSGDELLLILATLVRLVPALIATLYVIEPREMPAPRVVRAAAMAGVVAALTADLVALVVGTGDAAPFDAPSSRLTNRVVLLDVALALGIGAWLDASPGWLRARRRWASEPEMRLAERLRILVEELAPLLRDRSRAAADTERARLAAELHATVLPPLRSALAASRLGSNEAIERGLDDAVDEVERLMASREPVIVDALGLLAGLEWLAERVQLRTAIPVEIDVEVGPQRPPNDIERAAFRVAQLALDNVARHSGASAVVIGGSIDADRLMTRIDDDGVGLRAVEHGEPAGERQAAVLRGRGLRDMRTVAEAVGGRLEIEAQASGGTSVLFSWTRR